MTKFAAVLGLLLLAFGGYVAGIPTVSAFLPLSPIAIGAGLTLVALTIELFRRPDTRAVTPLLVLGLAFVPGFVFAQGNSDYATEKSIQLLLLVPLTAFGAAVCVRDRQTLKWLLGGILAVGLGIGFASFFYTDESLVGSGRFAAEGSNTTAAGRAAAAALIVAVVCVVHAKYRSLALIAAGFLAVAAVLSGARGPIAAVAIGLVVALLLSRSRVPALIVVVLAVIASLGYQLGAQSGVIPERLLTVEDNSAQARGLLAEVALNVALSSPFGIGWGGLESEFPKYSSIAIENVRYPHNIFVEAAAEGGFIALGILVVTIIISMRRIYFATGYWAETGTMALLLFFAVNAFVSGDLVSNRGFWLMLGVGLAAISRGPRVSLGASSRDEDSAPVRLPGGRENDSQQA